MNNALRRLADEGVSIWLDDLSRPRIESGSLARLVAEGVTGVTTNPSIFRAALRESVQYRPQVRELARLGVTTAEVARLLLCWDVRAACDVLRPVHEATDGRDGWVSIEVDPALAHDTERTISEAALLRWLVDRPNVMIKIPATAAGLRAVTACLARGISVNVTLIFSLGCYREVQEAYIAGLRQARRNGHDLSRIASVASVFISRVDVEVDARLEALGTDGARALRGRTAIANATLIYRLCERASADPRWPALVSAGARPQRPLWASTGVKDPDYEDTRYVTGLVAPGTVNTVPEATLNAVLDHGVVDGDRLSGREAQARKVFTELAALGVDVGDVSAKLEREGIAAFQLAWRTVTVELGTMLNTYRSAVLA